MPLYRVSFTNRIGRRQDLHLEAKDPAALRGGLSLDGATDITIHAEELFSSSGRDLVAEARLSRESLASIYWRVGREWSLTLAICIFLTVSAWRGRVAGDRVPVMTYVTLAVFVYAVFAISPLVIGQALERALTWHDWKRALALIPLMTKNPLSRQPALKAALAFQEATALAGLHRVDEALQLLDRALPKGGANEALIESMRASLLSTARRYDDALVHRLRAAELDPMHVFDAAIAILRYGTDVEKARALLASRDGAHLTELERIFREWAHALLALADQRCNDALAHLDHAATAVRTQLARVPAKRDGFLLLLDGYQALALVSLGDEARATAVFERAKPFLLATEQNALLARYRAACGRSAS